jgi:homoserine O-succinyltransferase
MPVIIHSHEIHPFLPSLGSPLAIDRNRAEQQDIRPLEIAIINLMADKISTERQLALWLGNAMLQVNLTFVATDSYVRGVAAGRHTRNTPADHIRKFYSAFSPPAPEVRRLRRHGRQRAEPSRRTGDLLAGSLRHPAMDDDARLLCLFLCWGAKAALKFFHDIDSHKGERKLFGLFEHRLISEKTGLLFGFPDIFPVPVSCWKSLKREDILKVPALEIVADSEEAGPNMLVESEPLDDNSGLFPRRVYILNHPEYETDTLSVEYHRDRANDPGYPLPRHYFPGDDPSRAAPNLWRHTAHIYTNWVKAVYESTPYSIEAIPNPSKIAEAVRARSATSVGS